LARPTRTLLCGAGHGAIALPRGERAKKSIFDAGRQRPLLPASLLDKREIAEHDRLEQRFAKGFVSCL
jgi:hypothetical protein